MTSRVEKIDHIAMRESNSIPDMKSGKYLPGNYVDYKLDVVQEQDCGGLPIENNFS